MSETLLATLMGLLGGLVLGLSARLSQFCTLGTIEDAIYGQNFDRARMWGLAIGTSILLVHIAISLNWVILQESYYLRVPFNPLFTLIGGLLFGVGMAFAGTCGFGALARLGGGDLRSFVIVLVMGVTAYAVASGPFSEAVSWMKQETAYQVRTGSISSHLSLLSGLPIPAIGGFIGSAILVISIWRKSFWSDKKRIFWAIAVGIAISGGWISTHLIAQTGFSGLIPVSYSFTAPIGSTILFLMTSSGTSPSFGVGSVCGVWSGALVGSLMKGHFKLEACEDPRELQRQIVGAMLMGVGAILAYGCSLGQGLSAMALLSFNAPIALISIICGAKLGLSYLITGRAFA
ncbi:MAG: YeeE/YedE family protein [Paracoccaceae bacterium]|nr:YeeE/YedE family protein [Paracoccaceae bacterium]